MCSITNTCSESDFSVGLFYVSTCHPQLNLTRPTGWWNQQNPPRIMIDSIQTTAVGMKIIMSNLRPSDMIWMMKHCIYALFVLSLYSAMILHVRYSYKSLSGSEVPKQLLHSLIPCFLHQFSLKNQNKHVLNITPPDPTQPVPSLPVSCSFHRHWEDIIRIFHKD